MKGDGRVFQLKRADGSLRSSRWWIGFSVNGREIRESAGKTEAAAGKVLRARLKQLAARTWVEPEQERMTVAEMLDTYESDLESRRAKSLDSIKCHLRPIRLEFGDRRAVDLRAKDFEKYRDERLAPPEEEGRKSRARQTVDHELGYLRAAYRLARKQERISRAPFIPMYHEHNIRRGWIEQADTERIAAELGDPLGTLTLFARASTWRRSEVEGLTWEQVDRAAREVRLFDSKNGRPRTLPLDDYLFRLIEKMAARREYATPSGPALSRLVFHRRGLPVGDWRKAWQGACVKAGLGRFEQYVTKSGKKQRYVGKLFHDCRRSGIRDLVRAGVPQSVVMSISGHRTISTFLRYDIAEQEDKREALEKARSYRDERTGRKVLSMSDARSR